MSDVPSKLPPLPTENNIPTPPPTIPPPPPPPGGRVNIGSVDEGRSEDNDIENNNDKDAEGVIDKDEEDESGLDEDEVNERERLKRVTLVC